jgi:hypothetical protein
MAISSKIITGLPQIPPDGTPPELYDLFFLVFRAIQQLQLGVSKYAGIDPEAQEYWSSLIHQDTLLEANLIKMYPIASVPMARGQLANLYSDAGILKARLARADTMATMAHGVVNSSAAAGEQFELWWMRGCSDAFSGMAVGTQYWLSPSVAGAVTATRPVAIGEIVQSIGFSLTATLLQLDINSQPQQL